MRLLQHKTAVAVAVSFILAIPLWLGLIKPQLLGLPRGVYYQADVVSQDNFYDEQQGAYKGPSLSKTSFYYQFIAKQNNNFLIKNVFDVRTQAGGSIFAVERIYAINPKTGAHVPELGDRERTGYLFAPHHLAKQDFVYWHINYDAPATMKFQAEETIQGLKVYRYEANYHVDQTANLGNLPGVPQLRGVDNDVRLQLWVEPVTGWLIKYQDNTTAYYYNQQTKQRQNPWNQFTNHFSEMSIATEVNIARQRKTVSFLVEKLVPVLLVIGAFISLGFAMRPIPKLPNRKGTR